jgi:UDP-N-acetylmuramate--alanine ligase
MPLDIGVIHFVGIGGIGMSGIAEILLALGYKVQGSDLSENANVCRLRDKGVEIHIGHDASHIENASIVVVSSAIKCDNPELIAAREVKLPVVRRAEMLAELMRLKWAVAIGGTHGKTTTTSLVGAMLEEAGHDPTVINGGIVNSYGTNTRMGQSDWMVVESDESDGTFTRLPATIAVVTNIDPEHIENYGSFDNMRLAYRRFVENIPFYGFAILCIDHPEVQSLIGQVQDKRLLTYGFSPQADVRASNLRSDASGSVFDVTFAGWIREEEADVVIRDVYLPMHGEHNVQNALVALSLAHEIGVEVPVMKRALENFAGVKRRFTKTGEVNGVTIIDDYGHHPVEIGAVLKAARHAVEAHNGRIIAVMQPHRYSRLSDLFDEFCRCFNDADTVIVADVYAAGEAPIDGVSQTALAQGIQNYGHRDVHVLAHPNDIPAMVRDMAQPNDMVIFLGAGDITAWANALPEQLEVLQLSQKKQSA